MKEATVTEWWYNMSNGEVEQGPQSLQLNRIGPFETRQDALRAPEIVAERARIWAEEDEEEWD